MYVAHGVVDGAENDGDVKNCVNHLCDVMSRGYLLVCDCVSVSA